MKQTVVSLINQTSGYCLEQQERQFASIWRTVPNVVYKCLCREERVDFRAAQWICCKCCMSTLEGWWVDGLGVKWYMSFKELVAVDGVLAVRVHSDLSNREGSHMKSQFGKSEYLNLWKVCCKTQSQKNTLWIWVPVLLLGSQPSP